jgi:hypothetical protein
MKAVGERREIPDPAGAFIYDRLHTPIGRFGGAGAARTRRKPAPATMCIGPASASRSHLNGCDEGGVPSPGRPVHRATFLDANRRSRGAGLDLERAIFMIRARAIGGRRGFAKPRCRA